MADNSANNQRIAKNTVLLYIRTAFVLFISLYTSRLVLQALGETDLGVYNVVGGIVSLMAFLQAAQSKATSRFITFEIGKGNGKEAITKVFSVSCTIHLIIVLIIIVLGETVGLWMVTHWITIPPERVNAAMVVYQCALLTFSIHIIRVPFDASVIAYEEMGAFAVFSIIEAVLKLFIPLILLKSSVDHLIGYSALLSPSPCMKNDTVIGTIGNTQGVSKAAKPQRMAARIMPQRLVSVLSAPSEVKYS